MFRQIVAAIGAVLSAIHVTFKSAAEWVLKGGRWVLESRLVSVAKMMPGAVLNTVGGIARGLSGVQPVPELPQPQHPAAERGEQELTEAVRQLGQRHLRKSLAKDPLAVAWRYACADDFARNDIDLSGLPREVRYWLQSLSNDELEAVRQAGLRATVLHCRGEAPILGLRAVRPLVLEGDLLALTKGESPRKPRKRKFEDDLVRAREMSLIPAM